MIWEKNYRMELKEIQDKLKEMIVQRLNLPMKPSDIITEDALFGENSKPGLDSIDALELVVGMEETFGITIEDGEIVKEQFFSVKTLSEFVSKKLG